MHFEKISYDAYVQRLISIHRDARREFYYYPLIQKVLEDCCTEITKVVPVYDNTGYKDEHTESQIHNRSNYADSHSLQDLIIVPLEYSYENTKKPYVTIEVKKPNMHLVAEKINYTPLTIGESIVQLEAEFEYCQYIIYTDGLTWYFLKKKNEDILEVKPKVCLVNKNQKIDSSQREWEELERYVTEIISLASIEHSRF